MKTWACLKQKERDFLHRNFRWKHRIVAAAGDLRDGARYAAFCDLLLLLILTPIFKLDSLRTSGAWLGARNAIQRRSRRIVIGTKLVLRQASQAVILLETIIPGVGDLMIGKSLAFKAKHLANVVSDEVIGLANLSVATKAKKCRVWSTVQQSLFAAKLTSPNLLHLLQSKRNKREYFGRKWLSRQLVLSSSSVCYESVWMMRKCRKCLDDEKT